MGVERLLLDSGDKAVVVAGSGLLGLVLVFLLVVFSPAVLEGDAGNALPALSNTTWIFMEESAVAYLSTVTMSTALVADSDRRSLCLRRVPSRQPLTKYWMA